MRVTLDDVAVVLSYCVLVPLVSVWLFLAFLPAYSGVAAWALHLLGVV